MFMYDWLPSAGMHIFSRSLIGGDDGVLVCPCALAPISRSSANAMEPNVSSGQTARKGSQDERNDPDVWAGTHTLLHAEHDHEPHRR